ncbi:immune-related, lectin-like receptor 4 isoform X1 [Ctenopharyngodon idella]|uniref:immune-related, lectin-like receptor 4 isoform X1 n=1 Tax=Ctenopharyngodon idella TaxID=7959 RepID=UPI0022326ED8|nr:immune-related, lectin-like receptor 4 isoform X1 [Ctenopharyngodon idella]
MSELSLRRYGSNCFPSRNNKKASQKTKPCGCDCVRLFLMALCALLTVGLIAFSFQYVYTEKKLKDLQQLHSALNENFTAFSAVLQDMHRWQQNQSKALNGSACPKDWEYHAGKCYLFSTNTLNWAESRDSCITDGGHLVIINSKNEQEFLMRIIQMEKTEFWIGLTDGRTEGQWLWVDNTQLEKSEQRYWYGNEPDDWKGYEGKDEKGEDCVIIKPEFPHLHSWFDAFCRKLSRRICETRSSRQT